MVIDLCKAIYDKAVITGFAAESFPEGFEFDIIEESAAALAVKFSFDSDMDVPRSDLMPTFLNLILERSIELKLRYESPDSELLDIDH